ncbi:hypothetical protein N7G274_005346 [Stereocaulon virgatum]|uniref:Uncharacterized protein n=1 Tax=Stereocaulon virgatum TaxID=373712 RepID=A0ABR4AFK8_9LECA
MIESSSSPSPSRTVLAKPSNFAYSYRTLFLASVPCQLSQEPIRDFSFEVVLELLLKEHYCWDLSLRIADILDSLRHTQLVPLPPRLSADYRTHVQTKKVLRP